MHTQIQCTTHTIPPISITMYQSARERIPPMAWVCQFRGTSIQSPWCCSFSISPISFHRSRHRPRHLLLARTNCCGSSEQQSTVLSCSAGHARERGDGLSGGEVFYCSLFWNYFPISKFKTTLLPCGSMRSYLDPIWAASRDKGWWAMTRVVERYY